MRSSTTGLGGATFTTTSAWADPIPMAAPNNAVNNNLRKLHLPIPCEHANDHCSIRFSQVVSFYALVLYRARTRIHATVSSVADGTLERSLPECIWRAVVKGHVFAKLVKHLFGWSYAALQASE